LFLPQFTWPTAADKSVWSLLWSIYASKNGSIAVSAKASLVIWRNEDHGRRQRGSVIFSY
jgi:hypothetical protein